MNGGPPANFQGGTSLSSSLLPLSSSFISMQPSEVDVEIYSVIGNILSIMG